MFKPARILQATSIFMLMAGCGSTQTTAQPPSSATTKSVTLAKMPDQPGADTALTSVPIQAGSSIANSSGFLGPDGELTPDIMAYAQEVSRVRDVPLADVVAILKTAQYNATASRLMKPGKTRIRRSWVTYRNRFVEPVRIDRGVEFWSEHKSTLDRTAREYGVPPSIIVAIIGVETVYGRKDGRAHV